MFTASQLWVSEQEGVLLVQRGVPEVPDRRWRAGVLPERLPQPLRHRQLHGRRAHGGCLPAILHPARTSLNRQRFLTVTLPGGQYAFLKSATGTHVLL